MNAVVIGKINFPEGMAGTKRIRHYVNYLNRQQINTKVISLFRCNDCYYSKEKTDSTGINYKLIGKPVNLNINQVVNLPATLLLFYNTMYKWKNKNGVNIVIIYGEPSIENILFSFISKIMKYKVVFDIVEDYEVYDEESNLKTGIKIKSTKILNNYIHLYADGVTVITNYLEEKYRNKSNNLYPVKLIPISASISHCANENSTDKEFKLVYAGSFAEKDGVEVLIEAVKKVSSMQKNISLYLTGGLSSEKRERIERLCNKSTFIKFLGYLEDKEYYKFISQADALCMTRLDSKFANAGFPFKLGEYLATGKPVIASNVSDVSLYLRDQIDVILVKPGDVESIEKAILLLYNDRTKAREIGLNGQKACAKHFNPETNGKLLYEFLKSL